MQINTPSLPITEDAGKLPLRALLGAGKFSVGCADGRFN
jgi:hypothetical protein